MVGDLRMWLYRAHPGNPRRCAGADHCCSPIGQSRNTHGSILSRKPRLRIPGYGLIGDAVTAVTRVLRRGAHSRVRGTLPLRRRTAQSHRKQACRTASSGPSSAPEQHSPPPALGHRCVAPQRRLRCGDVEARRVGCCASEWRRQWRGRRRAPLRRVTRRPVVPGVDLWWCSAAPSEAGRNGDERTARADYYWARRRGMAAPNRDKQVDP
jgi:hypothetical protein